MQNVLDLTYLSEISGGDNGFVKEMLELFNNTTAIEAQQFNELLSQQNWDGIGQLAHKLKAPIQMLGASELFNIVKNLELFGKEKVNLNEVPQMIQRVNELISSLSIEITEALKTL